MSFSRGVKHFVLTLEKRTWRFHIAEAKEIVPCRTYEIIEPIKPSIEFQYTFEGIGLGQSIEKKGSVEIKKSSSSHNH